MISMRLFLSAGMPKAGVTCPVIRGHDQLGVIHGQGDGVLAVGQNHSQNIR